MRIGLISDTHIPSAGRELPTIIADVFSQVDMILHAGDIYVSSVLDWLESIAPVVAAKGNGDHVTLLKDDRIKEKHILTVGGLHIGLIHDLPGPRMPLDFTFPGTIDVIVHGHSHEARIENRNGVLLVNPGSPTLPHNYRALGTVALLDIVDGKPSARVVQLC